MRVKMLFDRILDKFKWLKKEPDVISEENISEQKDEFEISFEELSKEIKLDAKLAAELSVNFSDFSNERLVSEIKNHREKLSRLKESVRSKNRLDLYDEIICLERLLASADKFCGLLSEKKAAEIAFPERADDEIKMFSEMIKDDSTEISEINETRKTLREKQIRRMQKGKFTTRAGLMYLEIIETMAELKA